MDKQKKLSVRVSIYCIVFGTIISLVIGSLGFYSYYKESMDSYRTYIETVLRIVENMIDADDLEQCIATGEKSSKYAESQHLLNSIKAGSAGEVEYIYILVPQNPDNMYDVIYACNAFTPEEAVEAVERNEPLLTLSDLVQQDGFTTQMFEIFHHAMFVEQQISYTPNNTGFGYMMTGVLPINNSGGEAIALACVDIPMDKIFTTLFSYVCIVLLGTVLILIIFLIIFIRRINATIVKPIKAMAMNADDFVSQSHQQTEPEKLIFQAVPVPIRDEIALLSDSLSNMTRDLVSYMTNLTQITEDKERMYAELNVAVKIRNSMMPNIFPPYPERTEFELYANSNSSRDINGAFYDYFFVDDSHLCMFIGEVATRGIPAALLMVIAKTMIKNYAQLGYSLDMVCAETNNQLSRNNESAGVMITAFLGIVDVNNGNFTYVNAGNQTPLLKHSGEEFKELPSKGCFALGRMENVPYWKQTTKLVQGDILFLYTDGVIGVKDQHGDSYSKDRLVVILNELVTREYEINRLGQNLEKDILDFTNENERTEDITMLLLRYFGS